MANLQAENARLRKALKPFADEAGHWDFYTADEPLVEGFPTYEGNITVGDLRDARAVLTGNVTVGGGRVDWGDQPVAALTGKADT
jgi:hypothetical protein